MSCGREAPRYHPKSSPVGRAWGLLIFTKRHRLDMDQVALAEKVGTSQATVSSWESGRFVPSTRFQVALMRVLGIADNELAAIYRQAA